MKILIATDGSEFSRAAIEKACEAVIIPENEVKIVSVYEDYASAAAEPFTVSAEYVKEMNRLGHENSAQAATQAEETIRACFPDAEIAISTKVAKGAPARAIVEEAEDWGADMIVMGSHGYGFWGRAVLGSVSNSVINHAPCSVFIVRNKGK